MELTESIESLNNQLRDLYGIDTVNGLQMWRIVWANDQYEKQLSKYSKEGIEFIHPQVVEIPKYPLNKGKYILENLVLVPEINQQQLLGSKISYEPIWVFERGDGAYLPPQLPVAQFVIETINFAKYGPKGQLAKYKENLENEITKNRDTLYAELFGNETDVTDALRYKEGVVVPSKQFGEN